MIFQLKITLKDSKPTIWRRVEMKDSSTFYDLHRVIQTAFEWTDSHLHAFSIGRMNSVVINDYFTIGPSDANEFGFGRGYKYDERELQLKEILKKEKDRVMYVYDFGDDWNHQIVLEKILPEESSVFYPRCTRALRLAPNEDSRFDYLETGIVTEEVNPKLLMEEINEQLLEVFEDKSAFTEQHGNVQVEEYTWNRLFDLTDEFKQLKPWEWLDDDQIFAVEDPLSGDYMFCSVMGAGGIEYGLAIYIGEEGLVYLNNLLNDKPLKDTFYLNQNSLILSFSDRKNLSNEGYKILKQHGRTYRGKNQWPNFSSYWPGHYPWILEGDEVRLFITVLEQVIEVCTFAKENPNLIFPYSGKRFNVRMVDKTTGTWKNGILTVENNPDFVQETPLLINELDLQDLKRSLKGIRESMEFDIDYFLSPIQDYPNARPYYPSLVLGIERENGLIVFCEMMNGEEMVTATQNAFLSFIKHLGRRPSEVWVYDEVAKMIQPIAKKLNIQLIRAKKLPLLENARREMEMMMPR